jgi:hypothetical protein
MKNVKINRNQQELYNLRSTVLWQRRRRKTFIFQVGLPPRPPLFLRPTASSPFLPFLLHPAPPILSSSLSYSRLSQPYLFLLPPPLPSLVVTPLPCPPDPASHCLSPLLWQPTGIYFRYSLPVHTSAIQSFTGTYFSFS